MNQLTPPAIRILLLVAILLVGARPALAQVQSHIEGSMAVMSEAVAGAVMTLIETAGCDTAAKLTYTGNYTPTHSVGQMEGTFGGQPAMAHIDSFFDVFFTLRYSGGFGEDREFFTGGGEAALSDGRDILILTAVGSLVPWDVRVIKNYRRVLVTAGFQIRDDGLIVITRQRKPIAKYKETSVFQQYPPFRRSLKKIRIAPNPGCIATFTETVAASGDAITGRVTLRVPS